MPQGFEVKGKNGRTKVLKLFKTLYGLRQIPRAFWKYMTPKMESCGMVQPNIDPCLFIGKKLMSIIYVKNILFWSVNKNDIKKRPCNCVSNESIWNKRTTKQDLWASHYVVTRKLASWK